MARADKSELQQRGPVEAEAEDNSWATRSGTETNSTTGLDGAPLRGLYSVLQYLCTSLSFSKGAPGCTNHVSGPARPLCAVRKRAGKW